MGGTDTGAKEEYGGVQEDFKTLATREMKPRYAHVPCESNRAAGHQSQGTSKILGRSMAPCRLIMIGTHPRPPIEK
jgi:hypothetical protein